MPRSEPLILKDGELKYPTPAQRRNPPWLLSVKNLHTGQRKTKKFESYQEAKERAEKLEATGKYSKPWDIAIISRQVGYGPPYSKISDSQLLELNHKRKWWCPYCRKLREFLWQPRTEIKHCPHCGISERDFHVIRCNPILWPAQKKRSIDVNASMEEEYE